MKRTALLLYLLVIGFSAYSQWLTDVRYNDHNTGITLGYVNQQFQFTDGDFQNYGDGIWGDRKLLHGISVGAAAQGNWDYGIGLYWAFNAEFYLSTNDPQSTMYASTVKDAFDTYFEMALQMPLHLALKLPLSDEFAIGFHTGPSISLTYLSMFSDTRGYFDDWSGLGDYLNVFNLTYDFSLYLEISEYRIEAQWSHGLINNGNNENTWNRVVRNKFYVGLIIFMD